VSQPEEATPQVILPANELLRCSFGRKFSSQPNQQSACSHGSVQAIQNILVIKGEIINEV
jgi:hypothetical protein